MSYYDGASSNFSWRSRGCTIPDSASDRTSVRSGGNDLSGASGVITPAQAYVRAVKTGQVVDRTLQYTIERSQPERKTTPHLSPPLQLSNPSSSAERGASYAQRLYASAVANKSSTNPSTSLTVEQPIAPPTITVSGPSRPSREPQHRRTSRSPTSPDSEREAAQTFSAGDFYHSGVSPHRVRAGSSTSTDSGLRYPQSFASVPLARSDRPRTSAAPISAPYPIALPAYALPLTSQPQGYPRRDISPGTALTSAPRSNLVHPRSRRDSSDVCEPPPSCTSHELSRSGPSSDRPPTDAARSRRPSSFVQSSVAEPPSISPPPFDAYEASCGLSGVADTPAAHRPSPNFTHPQALHTVSLSPPPETSHEAVPLYSLVDETQPPPSFDDIQPPFRTPVPNPSAQPEASSSTAVSGGWSGDPSSAPSSPPPERARVSATSDTHSLSSKSVKMPLLFTRPDAEFAESSSSGSATLSGAQGSGMSPPMSPHQMVPSYGTTPPLFSAQNAACSPPRSPSAMSWRSAYNRSTNSAVADTLGVYPDSQSVDGARRASVSTSGGMQRESDMPPPASGAGTDPAPRATCSPIDLRESVPSEDPAEGGSSSDSVTHAMANLMRENTSSLAFEAHTEYEEFVGESVLSGPHDGSAPHSFQVPGFTDALAPPPYHGVETTLQEASTENPERTATGAQRQPERDGQHRAVSPGCPPTYHVTDSRQVPIAAVSPTRSCDELRGAAAAVGPSGRFETDRPQSVMQPGASALSNTQQQHAQCAIRPGTMIREEDATFPPYKQQSIYPQTPQDVGSASRLPPPASHAAGHTSKAQPSIAYTSDSTTYPKMGTMNSNELAKRFAREALLGSRGGQS